MDYTRICFTLDNDQVDDYECECGNTSHHDGFYPVDWEGQECEPIEGIWSDLYECHRCGAYSYVDDRVMESYSVRLDLSVKAIDAEDANRIVTDRMRKWILEPPIHPPFPPGALLLWNIVEGAKE